MRSPNNPIQFAAVRDQRKLRGNHVILTHQFPASGNLFRDDGADFGILDAEFAEALMGIRGTRSLIHTLQYRANSRGGISCHQVENVYTIPATQPGESEPRSKCR